MDDRWREIERIYHAALKQEKSARPAFLAKVCAGASALRQEVESLLEHDEQAENFLKTPAIEEAAEALAEEELELRVRSSGPGYGRGQVRAGEGNVTETPRSERLRLGSVAGMGRV